MKSRKKFLVYVCISILSFIGLVLFINTFDPSKFLEIGIVKVSPVIPFFFLLFLAVSGLSIYLLASKRRGLLIGIFAASFLLLQYLHYNNVFYTVVLLIITILLEILFWKKR